jgi:hypothetical protein
VGRHHQRRGKGGQKSTLTERGHTLRRTVPKNHGTAAAQLTAELNIHLEEPASTKTVRREHQKSNIHGRAAIARQFALQKDRQQADLFHPSSCCATK